MVVLHAKRVNQPKVLVLDLEGTGAKVDPGIQTTPTIGEDLSNPPQPTESVRWPPHPSFDGSTHTEDEVADWILSAMRKQFGATPRSKG